MNESNTEFVKRFKSLLNHNNANKKDGLGACDRIKRTEKKIEQQQKALKKYGRHTKACNSHFIDSDLDQTCNTFGKCDCGFAEVEEMLNG